MTREIPLGPGVEFDVIRAMLGRWGPRAVGIGDDAATLQVPRGDSLVVSVDSAVEYRHFRRQWLSPREIGYRAVAAAVSDLAAMAAWPLGILVALTLPDAWRPRLEDLADGIGEASDAVGAPILGGNLSGGTELSITTTVLGRTFMPLARRGARPGDLVYVTGVLGGPGAALRLLESGGLASPFLARFTHPVPRLHEARWLASYGASAAIDVSDGLVADLRHLATASGVGIEVDGSRVPRLQDVGLNDAVTSGEEYELVVTAPRPFDVAAFQARFDLPLTEIGRVAVEPKGGVEVRGMRVANATGHDHFSR